MKKIDSVSEKIMLKVDSAFSAKLEGDWEAISKKLDDLKKFNTDGLEPMTHIFTGTSTFLREDEAENVPSKEEILANAKTVKGDYVILPKVVSND